MSISNVCISEYFLCPVCCVHHQVKSEISTRYERDNRYLFADRNAVIDDGFQSCSIFSI